MTDSLAFSADTRLIAYGTLTPGERNAHQLAELDGRWTNGTILGRRVFGKWYGEHMLPGLILDDTAGPEEVHVFESHDLPQHWARLDAFEGPKYFRTVATVTLPDGSQVEGNIYAIAPDA